MPNPVWRLSLVEIAFIIVVFICQQFEDLFLRLQLYAEDARQLALHYLELSNHTSQDIHLGRSRMVPRQCTDNDVSTPLLDRLMWQEHADRLRRTHHLMQTSQILMQTPQIPIETPRIPMQQQQGCTRRLHQNLVSSQEMATQTSPDEFGTVVEAQAEVTCPKRVTSGTAPVEESPAPAVTSTNAVSSPTAMAPTTAAAATTAAAGIAEVPCDQEPMTQDSGYSSNGMQDEGGAVSRESLPRRPGDLHNAALKNSSDRNHDPSGDGVPTNNSDDEGRDDEEHG
ncbi:uncharacterized protein [Haliotis asinina]|uniref:uncharacterized protein n=1 Tax=Haliotis asinina TaxID=109174 RepID=UPI003531FFE6